MRAVGRLPASTSERGKIFPQAREDRGKIGKIGEDWGRSAREDIGRQGRSGEDISAIFPAKTP